MKKTTSNSANEAATTSNIKWYKKIPWLKLLGGALIFFSWVAQNKFKSDWTDEKNYLQQVQMFISVEDGRMNQWWIAYEQEPVNPSQNEGRLALYALKLLQAQTNLIAWGDARLANNDQVKNDIIEAKNAAQKRAIQEYESKNYKAIFKALGSVVKFSNEHTDSQIVEAGRKLNKVRAEEKKWDTIFIALYIIGSCLLAIQFFQDHLKTKSG